ncbi:hypothetical protein [Neorhodopirellula lusitana]|nr:hypothetical protein [Neorhodopirellula lusitana]
MSAENVIGEIFDDPDFWLSNGCFICDNNAEQRFHTFIQLQPAIYETVVVGPERSAVPVLHTVVRALFGRLAGYAVLAADAATQQTERVIAQEEDGIEISLQTCRHCSSRDNVTTSLAEKLAFHALFLEMKEDFPAIRITKISPLHQNGG